MLRNLSELFLASLLIIYVIPYLIFKLFKTDRYAPLAVVQIVSGILLGPGILGHLYPNLYNYLFTKDNINSLSGVAWLGVIFFVWTAGVHLDIKAALENKKDMLVTSSFALASPLLIGSIFAYFVHSNKNWVGPNAMTWQFILGVGMALAVTALPILIILMEKLEIFNLEVGKRVLRYASLDDIMIWAVLSIIIMDWDRSIRQILFIPVFVFLAYFLNKFITKIKNSSDLWMVSVFWVVLTSLAADWSGLHYIVGGFLAGAVMKKEWFNEKQLESFKEVVLMLMMPVFFLITGLRTAWTMGDYSILTMAIALFLVQFVGKNLGIFAASKVLKWKNKDWQLIGVLLQTKALIEIIFCTILLDKGIITSHMFTSLLLMAIISTCITIPISKKIMSKNKHLTY